jgi:hypothetical protein
MEYKIIGDDGHEYGPVDESKLKSWAVEGRVGALTLVWRSDTGRWAHAENYDELKGCLAAPGEGALPVSKSIPAPANMSSAGYSPSYTSMPDPVPSPAPVVAAAPVPQYRMQGRSSTILAMGLISLIGSALFSCACVGFVIGPALGIPAWIMGAGDLRRMNDGLISPHERPQTRAGMIFGILGTFLGPILAAVSWVVALGTMFTRFFE